MENPQDPGNFLLNEAGGIDDNAGKDGSAYPIKRKPNRALLFIRNRASTSNVTVCATCSVLLFLAVHRLLSLYMTNRKWINAPITYMQRSCPRPEYETMSSSSFLPPSLDAGKDAATTVEAPVARALTATSDAEKELSSLSSAPKICLTTLTDAKSPSRFQRFIRWRNFDGIMEMTWKNKANYARKHGYQVFDGSDLIDTSRPPAWSKIIAVRRTLVEGDCDWVMWTDADTVIMNSDLRIEDFLPVDGTKDMLVASDYGGGYNSGVFVLRNTEWSVNFLDRWWNMKSFVRPPGFSLSGDNNAMKALLRDMTQSKEFDEHVLSPARCTFNSFAKFLSFQESVRTMDNLDGQEWYLSNDYYHKGDFIAHIPGYDNKAQCLRLLLKEAR